MLDLRRIIKPCFLNPFRSSVKEIELFDHYSSSITLLSQRVTLQINLLTFHIFVIMYPAMVAENMTNLVFNRICENVFLA